MVPRTRPTQHLKLHLDQFSRFFAQLRTESSVLYNGRPFPLKLSLHMGRPGLPSNTWFPLPTRVHIPSVGSAVFLQGSR